MDDDEEPTLRIDYDDNLLDVIDKVNEVLEEVGLRFEDDGKDHDGWNEYTIVELDEDD